MKKRWIIGFVGGTILICLVVLAGSINPGPVYAISGEVNGGPPLTDTFTYQGYLEQGAGPANGYFDFDITIWDALTLGNQITSCTSAALDNVFVQDGLFTFHLIPTDAMSTVFNGAGRYLQVKVRQHGTVIWTTLPRQPITAVPYAWSLRPGAKIEGVSGMMLTLNNTGSGGALSASSGQPTGITIAATHTGDGYALFGSTGGGYPAVGAFNTGVGVGLSGYSGTGIGVNGYTNATTGIGVSGFQTGYSTADIGLWKPGGMFGGLNGVIGVSKQSGGYGVYGVNKSTTGDSSIGVYGETTSTTGWAGYFVSSGNGVYIYASGATGLAVAHGTKNAVVETDQGDTLLYTEESSEVWFSDYGFGKLENGSVVISIDPIFAQTVNLNEPYHVFLQAYGDAEIYVTNRTAQSFEVRLSKGDAYVEFSYRLVGKRLGFETDRLEILTGEDGDPAALSSEPLQQQNQEVAP